MAGGHKSNPWKKGERDRMRARSHARARAGIGSPSLYRALTPHTLARTLLTLKPPPPPPTTTTAAVMHDSPRQDALEVEEEAHAPPPAQAQKDARACEVDLLPRRRV